ncbi:hypothetical protein DFP73DRAFT_375173 [Morchella snyderi]|nr:hypothetical protein DFP73DRAFT_375173 [Morchella snyderi]
MRYIVPRVGHQGLFCLGKQQKTEMKFAEVLACACTGRRSLIVGCVWVVLVSVGVRDPRSVHHAHHTPDSPHLARKFLTRVARTHRTFQSVVVGSAEPMIDCIISILSIELVAIACDACIRHCVGKSCLCCLCCLMVNAQAVSSLFLGELVLNVSYV